MNETQHIPKIFDLSNSNCQVTLCNVDNLRKCLKSTYLQFIVNVLNIQKEQRNKNEFAYVTNKN